MEKEDYLHLMKIIGVCSLGKLSKHFEEQKHYAEYDIRNNNLEKNIVTLRQYLGKYDLRQCNEAIEIISMLKILHEELMTEGEWNDQKSNSLAILLDNDFKTLYNVSLKSIFTSESEFNAQDILDMSIETLNNLTAENFKQFPSLIEVYRLLIHEIQESKLTRMPQKSLSISSLLMNDFDPSNKVKGLKCCKIILQNLWSNGFDEVTFQTLNKIFKEKDLEITKLLVECQIELMRILPLDNNKAMKLDVVLSIVLEEILLDANFYRKTILMGLLQEIIALHGINCVSRKKSFNSVICDSIDMCTSISIREVMLADILQCTEVWIKYCWAAWNYHADQKLLRMMLKTLYVLTEKEELYLERIQNIIVSMIFLCEKQEQDEIITTLQTPDRSQNSIFFARLDEIITRLTGKVI